MSHEFWATFLFIFVPTFSVFSFNDIYLSFTLLFLPITYSIQFVIFTVTTRSSFRQLATSGWNQAIENVTKALDYSNSADVWEKYGAYLEKKVLGSSYHEGW